MFNALENNEEISKITNGEWTNIYYYGYKWYLCHFDEKGNRITDETPFAFAFALALAFG